MKEPEWSEWLATRPPQIRAVAERLPPDVPYRLKGTGQKVWIYCYDEHPDGTVSLKIDALHKENPMTLNAMVMPGNAVRVFGVSPDDLEPWDSADMRWEDLK